MARGVHGTAGHRCEVDGCTSRDLLPDPATSSGFRSICKKHHSEKRIARKAAKLTAPEPPVDFTIPELPSELPPIDELLERRRREWVRKETAHEARRLIPVAIHAEGPVGLAMFGDIHIDDSGTNFPLLESCTQMVVQTEGMFAGFVGDIQNAWVGRLAREHAKQPTSASEAWALVVWLLHMLDGKLLFVCNGNHDAWAWNVNGLDPLEWIKTQVTPYVGRYGVRMQIQLPNGMTFNINCRHDFSGRSEQNPAFGVTKANRFSGLTDDLALAGHIHTAGYNPLKNPQTGKTCHNLRIGSFKQIDSYALEAGFPDGNFAECPVAIFDIDCEDRRHLVHVDFNPFRAARVLTMLRAEWKAKQPPAVAAADKKRRRAA